MAEPTLSHTEMERRMTSIFETEDLSESDFDRIKQLLALAGKTEWSVRPRTYAVLRMIGSVNILDEFVIDGLKDIAFPYSSHNLPSALHSQSLRFDFLAKQHLVFTKATDLESDGGSHRHFGSDVDSLFLNLGLLGRGSFGDVHHMQSKLSLNHFARKRIHRKKAHLKDKAELATFENELSTLKRLSHHHLVQFKGSYTDPKFVGLLMSPVADSDLRFFLDSRPLSAITKSATKTSNLKPQNILVKDEIVLITDFGCARDWSKLTRSTTVGVPDAFTREYASPEVVFWDSRGSSADIWSLGCVFLDMVEALNGFGKEDRLEFLKRNGNGEINLSTNLPAAFLWLDKPLEGLKDSEPFKWIRKMIREDRNDRILAASLLEEIQSYKGHVVYYGHCCADDEDDSDGAASYQSSVFEKVPHGPGQPGTLDEHRVLNNMKVVENPEQTRGNVEAIGALGISSSNQTRPTPNKASSTGSEAPDMESSRARMQYGQSRINGSTRQDHVDSTQPKPEPESDVQVQGLGSEAVIDPPITPELRLKQAEIPHALAGELYSRYRRTKVMADLEEVIDLDRKALMMVHTDGTSVKLRFMSSLVVSLQHKFNKKGTPALLDEAFGLTQQLIDFAPSDDPDLPNYRSQHAFNLFQMYRRTQAMPYLDESIRLRRESLQSTWPKDPENVA